MANKKSSTTYVHKFLADAGCGSRRSMVEAMKAGQVKVNGKTIQDPTYLIDPTQDTVSLGKKVVEVLPPAIHLMLNKPTGYITTNNDPQNRRTVFDLVPDKFHDYRLFAIGRLDIDTSGLLILTNDGILTNRLTHPRFQHQKEYEVTVARQLTPRQIRQFQRGLLLDDGRTAPASITQVFSSQKVTYHLTIHEGRKRQVRRMFEHVGSPLLTLKRIRIGNLWLDPKLKSGQARQLTPHEVELLKQPGHHNP